MDCTNMKKRILIWAAAIMVMSTALPVEAADIDTEKITAAFEGIKDSLSEAFSNMDSETAENVFSFVKEKVSEGNLGSEEGLKAAIEEGEEEFGVTISEEDAQKVVDTMEKLEDMGFDSEYVIDKAESLYEKYGADFVEHADEVVSGAVKNAVQNVAQNFFSSIWQSVKSFFGNIFSWA